jgi:GAF domain-containing protein
MVDRADLGQTVRAIVAGAREHTTAAEVGVFRRRAGAEVEVAGTSTELVRRADELQLQLGQGPCRAAALTNDTYRVDHLDADRRWPRWTAAAAGLGWRSILSIPLATGGGCLGALNLYSDRPWSFSSDDAAAAQVFARHASLALGLRLSEERLREEMRDQHLLGLAQGILMERYQVTTSQAAQLIEDHARQGEVTPRALAERIIAARRVRGSAPPREFSAADGPGGSS